MTSKFRRLTLSAMAAAALAAPFAMQLSAHADAPLKVGFLVKMPEQAWFINEQKAASALGQKDGFSVVNIGTPDGEKVLSAIDNLGAQGAKGFVICAPDVRLGPAIQARAKRYNMKFVTVDDQLVDSTGKPLPNVPHLGMSAFKIGNQVGTAISEEMKRRGWKPEEVGALRITNYELPTAKLRTDGATESLIAGGFKKENIFDAPQKTTDDEGGFNASSPVLAQHPNIKKWVIFALNEESVLGGVRATEQLHIPGRGRDWCRHQRRGRSVRRIPEEGTDGLLRHDRRELDDARQGKHGEPRRVDQGRQAAARRYADHRQADGA